MPGRVRTTSAAALVAALADLEPVIGTGEEPDGLCADKADHAPHLHDSPTLGRFWCTADQRMREPYRSEQRRNSRGDLSQVPRAGDL